MPADRDVMTLHFTVAQLFIAHDCHASEVTDPVSRFFRYSAGTLPSAPAMGADAVNWMHCTRILSVGAHVWTYFDLAPNLSVVGLQNTGVKGLTM